MTAIEKNTAKLMQQKLQAKLDKLFAEQQAMNGNKGGSTFKRGGLVHANNGWYEDPVTFNGRRGMYNSNTMPYNPGNVNVYGTANVSPLLGGPNMGSNFLFPDQQGNSSTTFNGRQGTYNSSTMPYQLGDVNVAGQRTVKPGTTSGNPVMLGDVNVQAQRTPPEYGILGNNPYKINFGIPPVSFTGTNAGNPYQLGDVSVTGTAGSPSTWYNGSSQFNSWENQPNPQEPYRSFSGGQGQPNVTTEQYQGIPDFRTPAQAGFGNDQAKVQAANGVIPKGGVAGKATGLINPQNNNDLITPPPANMFSFKSVPEAAGSSNFFNQSSQYQPKPGSNFFNQSSQYARNSGANNNLITPPPPGGPMDQNFTATEAVGTGPNWGKIGTFAGQVAPMVYNMFKGLQKPDKVKPMYNPYEGQIRSAMANRRFNIDPLLNANMVANAVGNRNIRNAANSRGEMMGNYGASQNQRMAGDAAAWAQKSNMDNQYLGEQAQMDAQLGQARAQTDWMTQDYNLRNKSATEAYMTRGITDVGQWAQMQDLMNRQDITEEMKLKIAQDIYGGDSTATRFHTGLQDVINNTKIR